MIQPIKNIVSAKNLRRATQNEEARKMGRAAQRAIVHAGREFAKVFAQEYRKEREKR
jgi:hypothetical protein